MAEKTSPQILTMELDKLRLNPKNARRHTPKQIRQIAESIKAFGFIGAILVDDDDMIVAGHGRYLALKLLGHTTVSVIRISHLKPAAIRAFALADNKLTDNSTWDVAILAENFRILLGEDLDFSLSAIGFETAEIDALLLNLGDEDESDPDDRPIDPGPAVSRVGDLWTLGRHRLLCASSLERESFARLLGEERAAIGFTDPPFGCGINGHVKGKGKRQHREFVMGSGDMSEPELIEFFTTVFRLMAAFSRDGSLHYTFIDSASLYALLTACRAAFDRLIGTCVWHKPNAGMGSLYRSAHELIVISKKGAAPHQNHVQLGKHGRHRTSVWTHAGANVFLKSAEDADLMAQHPTPKPVRLIVEALLDASSRGDIVLEPFCGSGSTLIAAERTGRVCRAIELDPLYVDLTIRRFRRHGGEDAVRQDGMSFSQLESQGGDHD